MVKAFILAVLLATKAAAVSVVSYLPHDAPISTTTALGDPSPNGIVIFNRCISADGLSFESCGSVGGSGSGITSVLHDTTLGGDGNTIKLGVNFSTVTTALSGKLSNSSAVPNDLVDLSTVTSALSGKLATTGTAASVASGGVDFSTITTALAGKLSSTVAVPNALIDLSTVTTSLAGKQPTGNYITALTGGVTASGPGSVGATVVTNANLTGPVTSVGNATTITGPVPPSAVNLSTVTSILDSVGSSTKALASIDLQVGIDTKSISGIVAQVGVDTKTLSVSTASIYSALNSTGSALTLEIANRVAGDSALGLSTNTLSGSTVAIRSILDTVGASTTTLSASTIAIRGILDTVGASTTTLSASTTAIRGILNTVGTSTTTLSASTVTLFGYINSTGSALTVETARAVAAEALKANLNGATFTGASGITNQSFTATGANGNIIGSSSFTASAFFGDGSHLSGVAGGTVGVSSSCSAGQYWDDANFLNGVANGGVCTTISAGSEGNTYTSSKTLTQELLVRGQTMSIGSFTVTGQSALMDKVGIGTTVPTVPLDVLSAGNVMANFLQPSAADSSRPVVRIGQGTAAGKSGFVVHGLGTTANSYTDSYIGLLNAGDTAVTQGLQIKVGGFVGIGANPATKLHMSSGTLLLDGTNAYLNTNSSVTASSFWGDGSHLSGLSSTEGNTYTSSKTFSTDVLDNGGMTVNGQETVIGSNTVIGASLFKGIVTVSTGVGFNSITGASTSAPCGPIFFVSSNTVAASTATAGTALTAFSTFTVLANTLYNPGDALLVTCAFQNGIAPGTPVAGTYMATVMGAGASTTANQDIIVQTYVTLMQIGKAKVNSNSWGETATATAINSVTTSAGISQITFDATANQTFHCKASRATGGAINFVSMKVSKACQ